MKHLTERSYLLNDLIGQKAVIKGKKIGKLADIRITEDTKVPEVTHLLISRPYGYKSLMIPWEKVEELTGKVFIEVDDPDAFEGEPEEGQVWLKDHLLDKKVLDCDEDEVEVVYDIHLTLRGGKLYATDVDCSSAAFLRRIGLRWMSNLIRGIAAKIKDDNTIPWTYVQRLPEDISAFKGSVKLNVLKEKLPEMHPVDLADILEELEPDERLAIFSELDTEQASDTLEEIEPRVQRQLIQSLDPKRAAELINDMTPAQAADILAELPSSDVDDLMELIDAEEAGKIRHLLEHHDEGIIHFSSSHYITFPPTATVGRVMTDYRHAAKDADVVMYVYIIDEAGVLKGVVDIKELLQANLDDRLEDIMSTNVVSLNQDEPVKEASRLFKRYSFRAIPILGENEVMVGVIPYRDIMNLQHRFV